MSISKITLGGTTLIDLTGDTITAAKLKRNTTAHGSDGSTITGTLWDFGANPTFLESYNWNVSFYDAGWTTQTASTTSATVKQAGAEGSIGVGTTRSLSSMDIIAVCQAHMHFVYDSSLTMAKGVMHDLYYESVFNRFYCNKNEFTTLTSGDAGFTIPLTTSYWASYHSSATAVSLAATYSYGLMPTVSGTTIYCATVSGSNITFKPRTPAVTLRANATYFSTDAASHIDKQNSTVKVQLKVYSVDKGTSLGYLRTKKLYSEQIV